jgi:hypothetical protein
MAFNVETEDGKIISISHKIDRDGTEALVDTEGNEWVRGIIHPMKFKLLKEVEGILEAVADEAIAKIKAVKEVVKEMIEDELTEEEEDPEAA